MKISYPRPGEPIRVVWTALDEHGERTNESDLRYRVVLDAGLHAATGKRRQVTTTHRTLTKARMHVKKVLADQDRGTYIAPDRTTWAKYAASWIEKRRRNVRANTSTGYKSALNHAEAAFGSKPLAKVTKADVERMAHSLAIAGRTKRTVAFVLFVVRAVLDDALDEGLVLRNVATKIKATGGASKEREPLSTADSVKLRAHLSADRLSAVWLLTLFGLRRSEVLALTWADVDLTDGTLSITHGVVADASGRRSAPTDPKTDRGRRTLPLAGDLLPAFRALREAQAAEFGFDHVRTGHLAVNEAAEPYRPAVWSELWTEHCVAAGVQTVTLHAARHGSVTAMRATGVPDQYVSGWHGHDESTMRRTYSHHTTEDLAVAGRALSDLLSVVPDPALRDTPGAVDSGRL